MNDPDQGVGLDVSRDVLRRAPGCLVALLSFVVVITVGDVAGRFLPGIVLAVVGVLLGFIVLFLYARFVEGRWGVAVPDPVELMVGDLTSVTRRSARDFRLRLPRGTPIFDRVLHESLYGLKWLGTLLVFVGLGTTLYRLMLLLGLVDP